MGDAVADHRSGLWLALFSMFTRTDFPIFFTHLSLGYHFDNVQHHRQTDTRSKTEDNIANVVATKANFNIGRGKYAFHQTGFCSI